MGGAQLLKGLASSEIILILVILTHKLIFTRLCHKHLPPQFFIQALAAVLLILCGELLLILQGPIQHPLLSVPDLYLPLASNLLGTVRVADFCYIGLLPLTSIVVP